MTFYDNMLPFFIISGFMGLAYMAYTFRRMRRPIIIGASLGAIAGVIGPMLLMAPLDSCTFEPERPTVDYHFGIFLFFVGALLIIGATMWLARFVLATGQSRQRLLGIDSSPGAFNTPWIVPVLLLAPTLFILAVFLYYPTLETMRLSTVLARLGRNETIPRCVTNFTELIEPSFSTPFFALIIILLLLAFNLFNLRVNEQTTTEGYSRMLGVFGIGAFITLYIFFSELWEEDYADIFFNTIFISSMIVILGLAISLGIAYLVFQPVKGASIYRTLLIWPYAISPPIAGILFFVMFDSTAGIIDHVIEVVFNVDMPNYKTDPWLARWVVIIASVWKTLGYNILFYIAGLQNVSKELVEAASIDGANSWQRFRNVIIPALGPITFFLIITNLTYAFFETYGTIDYLTKGAPAGATTVAIYDIIVTGFERGGNLGRAAARSMILFMMVIAVTFWQFRTSGRRVTYGA